MGCANTHAWVLSQFEVIVLAVITLATGYAVFHFVEYARVSKRRKLHSASGTEPAAALASDAPEKVEPPKRIIKNSLIVMHEGQCLVVPKGTKVPISCGQCGDWCGECFMDESDPRYPLAAAGVVSEREEG